MTKQEAEAQVRAQGYCLPYQYEAIQGLPWNGKSRFIWLDSNLDLGYRIKYNPAKGGSQPNPSSESQRQPWLELGISQATYYRRKFADRKWSTTFTALGITDTPANRTTYTRLARAADLLGRPVRELWLDHLRTLGPGESSTLSSSSDNDEEESIYRGPGCVGIGMCDACHMIHPAPTPTHE